MSVSLTAPAAFRWLFDTAPERHVHAARPARAVARRPADDADHLPLAIAALMRDIGIPNGIGGVGFGEADVPTW
jgi:alcohol dehydrogenase class IV